MLIDTAIANDMTLPLFGTQITCDRCQNIGMRIGPTGVFEQCPVVAVGQPHAEPNPAGTILRHFADVLRRRHIAPNSHAFDVAKTLTGYTTAEPCPRDVLLDTHFTWTSSRLRKFHHAIEELRSIWLLPVGSRKEEPSGYWIITDVDDFAAWADRYRSAPITQLSTLHRVARANFPLYAEQLELDFWSDIARPESEDETAASGNDIAAAPD